MNSIANSLYSSLRYSCSWKIKLSNKKPSLWERTKDIATTYTGTFIAVMTLNQLLFFGFCLNPICLVAAMPHVLLITVAIGTFINKAGNWGERQIAKKTTQSISHGAKQFGNAYSGALEDINKAASIELKKAQDKRKELDKLRSQSESINEPDPKQFPRELNFDKYRPLKTPKVEKNLSISNSSTALEIVKTSYHDRTKSHRKVFITRNNLNSIVHKADATRFSMSDFDALYRHSLADILSHREMALLCVYKEVCQDPNTVFESYKKVESSKTKGKYVFEGGAKSYHKDQFCELLHGDYFNIEIPPEIKEKGQNTIKRFRDFCMTNKGLMKTDEVKFLTEMEVAFMLVNPPTAIRAANSGVEEFENVDLEVIEQQIDELLIDANSYRQKSKTNSDIIDRLGYGTDRVNETKNPDSPLHSWHFKYKLPLKELMRHYFRIKFNKDLSFDGFLLEKLGLTACKKCGG